ncbi:hypothetical protein ACJX0J_017790, partial [Zea mays]
FSVYSLAKWERFNAFQIHTKCHGFLYYYVFLEDLLGHSKKEDDMSRIWLVQIFISTTLLLLLSLHSFDCNLHHYDDAACLMIAVVASSFSGDWVWIEMTSLKVILSPFSKEARWLIIIYQYVLLMVLTTLPSLQLYPQFLINILENLDLILVQILRGGPWALKNKNNLKETRLMNNNKIIKKP